MESVTRYQWISEAAYYKAEARNFTPGRALNDWLKAENDYVNKQIADYISKIEEDGAIAIMGLQQLAKSIGIADPESINLKIELVHAIQNASNHRTCFRSEGRMECNEVDCKWRTECRKLIAEWRR